MAGSVYDVSGSSAIVFTPRFKMEADITMSNDETELLIPLWEQHQCLLDPSDSCYKNRGTKRDALLEIEEAFYRGWNAGECSNLVA